ncbi:MAG: hypothetical protein HY908_17325 [Myxococcales bacterium]|nr:hypothetical protein [Myxococcales bacterium]
MAEAMATEAGDPKSAEDEKRFDVFELMAAIVLGLAAVGGAWAAFQSGLWGGNQASAYAEAANMMSEASALVTEASNLATEASMTANRDADIDLQVKRLLFEGAHANDEALAKRNVALAKYLYSDQLSPQASKFLGIPEREHFEDITDAELAAANAKSLDDKYFDALYAEASSQYDVAEKRQKDAKARFFEGQIANYNGDVLSLTAVLYTVCLFLAGIGLVFKTRVRWAFGGLAVVALVASSVHIFSQKWTGLEAPQPEAPPSATAGPAAPSASAAATQAPAEGTK